MSRDTGATIGTTKEDCVTGTLRETETEGTWEGTPAATCSNGARNVDVSSVSKTVRSKLNASEAYPLSSNCCKRNEKSK
jgi:Tfp pilus assembly protein PilV